MFFKKIRETIGNQFQGDNVLGSSVNLMNSLIGSGMLFLPYILATNGVIFGLGAMALGCVCFIYTKSILVLTLNELRRKRKDLKQGEYPDTLEGLGGMVFGEWFNYLVKCMLLVYCFGVVTAYQTILTKTLCDILSNIFPEQTYMQEGEEGFYSFRLLIAVLNMALTNLFGLSEKIRDLRVISYISIGIVYFFVASVTVLFFAQFTTPMVRGEVRYLPDWGKWQTYPYLLLYTGVVTLSYGTQSVTSVHSEFQTKNLWKLMISLFNAHIWVFVIYAFVAIFGYFSFLEATARNVVLSYEGGAGATFSQKIVSIFLKFLIYGQLMLTAPTVTYRLGLSLYNMIFEVKSILNRLFGKKKKKKEVKEPPKEEEEEEEVKHTGLRGIPIIGPMMTLKFLTLTVLKFFAVGLATFIAFVYPDSMGIISYLGAGLGTIISHLIQQMLFLKYYPLKLYQKLLVCFGVFVTVFLLGVIPFFLKIADDVGWLAETVVEETGV